MHTPEPMLPLAVCEPDSYDQRISPCYTECLPLEILEAIFIDCARHYYSTTPTHLIPTVPGCANVSYVNRRWRAIALNCPILWTYLFNTSPRWTEELLVRSKQALLKLCLDLHYPYQNLGLRTLEQVMNHAERIQELRLHIWSSAPEVLSLLSSPVPRLQSLEILVAISALEWSVLFGGRTPALHALELTGCSITLPLVSSQLSGLDTLVLRDFSVQFRKDMVEFLNMMRNMPDLSYLHLEDVLCSANSSVAFRNCQKINLPHLSRLFIRAPLSTISALLSCVNAPLDMGVRLEGSAEDHAPSLDEYAPLCSLLEQRFYMSEDQLLCNKKLVHSLNIAFTDQEYVKITFGELNCERDITMCHSLLDAEWDPNVPLQIVLYWPLSIEAGEWADIASHVCLPTPLSYIQNLYVSNPPASLAFWMRTLEHLPGLRYIKLNEGDMPPIVPILVRPSRDCMYEDPGGQDNECSNRGGGQTFVPELAELELHDIAFSTENHSDPLQRADLQALCDALSARTTRVRLTVIDCVEGDRAKYVEGEELNIVGQWEGDRFCVERRELEII